MRKLLALCALLAAGVASAGPVVLDSSVQKTFTNCDSGGSSAQTIAAGSYLVTVHDEAVWLCLADSSATCASGGTKLPAGTVMLMSIGAGGKSAACRSSGSTGDVEFTKAG